MERTALFPVPPCLAVIVAFTFVFTDFVVIEKEADVFPESTVTTGGTCADAGALLVMYTCTPSFGFT
jgi:hypothetical protein